MKVTGVEKHDGPPGSRPYRMGKRAEQVEETRRRIVQATVDLHTTVGPANTTVSAIAERAGVTRLTVYRHFPEQDALFQACFGHWSAQHPWPDPEAWRSIVDPQERARRGLVELYAWYGEHAEDLLPIYRDLPVAPRSSQEAVVEIERAMADTLVAGWDAAGGAGGHLRATAVHVVGLWTWHSLAVEQELGDEQAAALAACLVRGAARCDPAVLVDTDGGA